MSDNTCAYSNMHFFLIICYLINKKSEENKWVIYHRDLSYKKGCVHDSCEYSFYRSNDDFQGHWFHNDSMTCRSDTHMIVDQCRPRPV